MSTDSAVSTPWLLPLILGVWLIVFPLFWLGITGLLASVGGWRELSASYAMDTAAWKAMPAQTTTGALQRSLLPVNYSHTLRVHVRDDGFALAPIRLFSFMHPPLFIPWTAVRECQDRTLLFWRYVEVTVQGSSVRIMVGGRPGRAMLEAWMSARVAAPGVPAVMYGR